MISAGFSGYAELGPAFERATGHRLVTTRGPSMGDSPEAIPARLARGETADVVILDGAAADELAQRGLVRAGSKVDLARSQIGMVVRAGAAKPDIGSVDAFRKMLLAAKSIGYSDSASGTYLSTTLFAKLGVADQVAGKSRKVRGPPSGEPVAAVVARGEVEIGFQQVSELIHTSWRDLRRDRYRPNSSPGFRSPERSPPERGNRTRRSRCSVFSHRPRRPRQSEGRTDAAALISAPPLPGRPVTFGTEPGIPARRSRGEANGFAASIRLRPYDPITGG